MRNFFGSELCERLNFWKISREIPGSIETSFRIQPHLVALLRNDKTQIYVNGYKIAKFEE